MNWGILTMDELSFLSCGDCAVTVEFSREINEKTNRKVRFLTDGIKKRNIRGVIDCVPTFRSVTIYYDPLYLSFSALRKKVCKIYEGFEEESQAGKRIFHIPVCYEEEYAPDMEDVCTITGLSPKEVIQIHSSVDYLIYMLGFLPGFPYLGGMDERITVPRLENPRTKIWEGSVGIGGNQTGIYPVVSPGGWRLIGRTPVTLYDIKRTKPILYEAGDYIRFYSIGKDEFEQMSKKGHGSELKMTEELK